MSSLSRKALLIKGSLMMYLQPKLAQDSRLDLDPLLADISEENFSEEKAALLRRILNAVRGKLAAGASVTDLNQLLNQLEGFREPEGNASDEPTRRPNREIERLTAEDRRPGSDEGFHNRFPAGRRIGVV